MRTDPWIELDLLIRSARTESSRLHRIEVDAQRWLQHSRRMLTLSDARIYRCESCGDWRYQGDPCKYVGARRCPCVKAARRTVAEAA